MLSGGRRVLRVRESKLRECRPGRGVILYECGRLLDVEGSRRLFGLLLGDGNVAIGDDPEELQAWGEGQGLRVVSERRTV